jgi:hypothetical protein
MIKPTKRKAFNFLRSYFDVLNELEKDNDKLIFLLSIINKQFLDEDPKNLNFIVNLCYESQRHQIESSVKGWKRASNDTLSTNPPTNPKTNPPTPKGLDHKEEEEKEEVKEKDTNIVKAFPNEKTFIDWFNYGRLKLLGKEGKTKILGSTDKNNFKLLNSTYTRDEFKHAVTMMSEDEWVKTASKFTVSHLLVPANFDKYLNKEKFIPRIVNNQPLN